MKFLLLVVLIGVASAFEQCGQKGGPSRIIGGQNAGQGEFPWQISLQHRQYGHICGGTLLNNQWVLSAAHCFDGGRSPSQFKIRVGEWHLNQRDGTEKDIPVAEIHVHSQWNSPMQFQHDVSIVKLAQPVDFSGPYVGPACVPPSGFDYRGNSDCWLSGWGYTTSAQNRLANTLQKAHGSIWTKAALQRVWPIAPPGTVGFGIVGKFAACGGDSGGPLVCRNRAGSWDLVGLVSFGTGECWGKPEVLTEVAAYRSWIERFTGPLGGGGGSGGGVVPPVKPTSTPIRTERPIIKPGGKGVAACRNAGPLVAHENDCSKYYQCTGTGQGVVGQCTPGLKFNPNLGNCDWTSPNC